MTNILPNEPTSVGNWRTANDGLANAENLLDRLLPGGGEPPPEGGGQPQIISVVNLNGNAEITVEMPDVPGADRFEWVAGSNNDHWESGTDESPNVSLTNQVVFQAPRQIDNDNCFFCYRGANEFGPAPNYNCNGFVTTGTDPDPVELGAPTIDSASATADGESVGLQVTPGANAENHDVHRVLGNTNFTASDGNRIEMNIGPTPASYGDLSATPDNIYSYRLTSKRAGSSPVQSNRVSVSTEVQQSPPPQGQYTGERPNEPSGFSRWVEHDFTGNMATGPCSHAGFINFSQVDDNSNYTVIPDSTMSSNSSLRIRYPQNFPTGSTPGRFGMQDTPSGTHTSTALREWYISLWILYEANPLDGGWEMPPVVLKTFYRGGLNRTGNDHQLGHIGVEGITLLGIFDRIPRLGIHTRRCPVNVNTNYRTSTFDHPLSTWMHWEFYEKLGDPDVANGITRFWVNGTQRMNRTDVQNTCSNNGTVGFWRFHWAPVFGGNCDPPCRKTRADFMRVGHLYISGIPQ